ncbi:MAG TPA: hypothetical protein VHE81_21785 [Lacipirellulaceae bacterium]|nr:hypothetical protein [Lacipirellulaceae bacterium]
MMPTPAIAATQEASLSADDVGWLSSHGFVVRDYSGSSQLNGGAEIAVVISGASARFPAFFELARHDLDRLHRCCAARIQATRKSNVKSGAPAGGELKLRLHSALIGLGTADLDDDESADPLAWVRQALLCWFFGRPFELRVFDAPERFNRICTFLAKPPAHHEVQSAGLVEWVRELGTQLDQARKGIGLDTNPPPCPCAKSKDLQANLLGLFQDLKNHFATILEDVDRPCHIPLPASDDLNDLQEQGLPLEDLQGEAVLISQAPTDADPTESNDGARRPKRQQLPPRNKRSRLIESSKASDSHVLHLSGPLIENSRSSLPFHQTIAIGAALMGEARANLGTASSHLRGMAAVITLLSGLTGRNVHLVQRALSRWLYRGAPETTASQETFEICTSCWYSDSAVVRKPQRLKDIAESADADAPLSGGYRKPDQKRAEQDFLNPVSGRYRFLWPADIQALLESIRAGRDSESYPSCLPADFELVWDAIRADVTRQFTADRFRTALPVALFTSGKAKLYAQVVTGADLSHSTAPLHYYSQSQAAVRAVYSKAISLMFGGHLGEIPRTPQPDDSEFVGAPCSAVRDEVIQAAVSGLRKRYGGLVRRDGINAQVAAYNALSDYSAAMFAFGVAHRQTYHFSAITLRYFDDNLDLVVFTDKRTDASEAARVAVLASTLRDQISYLRSAALGLSAALRASKPASHRKLAVALAAVADGSAPLFSCLDAETGVATPIDRHSLARRWRDLPVPTTRLRARLATSLLAAGADPSDIYRQLGHAIEVALFGADDPESIPSWTSRLRPFLDKVLKADGWEALRAHSLEGTTPSRIAPLRSVRVLSNEAQFWADYANDTPRIKAKKSAIKEFSRTVVETIQLMLKGLVTGYSTEEIPRDIILTADRVRALRLAIDEMADLPDKKIKGREILVSKLTALVKNYQWQVRPMPPLLFTWVPAASAITPACVEASRTANKLMDDVLGAPLPWEGAPQLLKRSIARAAIVFALDGGISHPDKLRAILQRVDDCLPYPDGRLAVTVPALLEPGLDRSDNFGMGRAPNCGITLVGASGLLALRMKSAMSEPLRELLRSTPDWLDGALTTSFPAEFDGSAARPLEVLCKLAALGRRLRFSGLLTGLEDARTPAKELTPKRFVEALSGSLVVDGPTAPAASQAAAARKACPSSATISDIGQILRTASGVQNDKRRNDARRIATDELRAISANTALSLFDRAIADWLRFVLESAEAATGAKYWLTTAKPFLLAAQRLRLTTPDSDSLAAIHDEIVEGYKGAYLGDRRQQFRRICTHGRNAGFDWEEVDLESPGPESMDRELWEATATIVTDQEYLAGLKALQLAKTTQGIDRNPTLDRAEFFGLQTHKNALRPSECAGIAIDDWQGQGENSTLVVRHHAWRRLKFSETARVISQIFGLRLDEIEMFSQFVKATRHRSFDPSTNVKLFMQDHPASVTASQLGFVHSQAIKLANGTNDIRTYGGRHSTISFWLLTVLCPETPVLDSIFSDRPGRHMMGPSKAARLLSTSRRAGHTRLRTSLLHYFHFAGELALAEQAAFGRTYLVKQIAAIAGVSAASLNNELSQKGGRANDALATRFNRLATELRASLKKERPDLDVASRSLASIIPPRTFTRDAAATLLEGYLRNGAAYLFSEGVRSRALARAFLDALITTTSSMTGRLEQARAVAIADLNALESNKLQDNLNERARPPMIQISRARAFIQKLDELLTRDSSLAQTLVKACDRMLRTKSTGPKIVTANEGAALKQLLREVLPPTFDVAMFSLKSGEGTLVASSASQTRSRSSRHSRLRRRELEVLGVVVLIHNYLVEQNRRTSLDF